MTKLEIIKKALAETETTLVSHTPEQLAKKWTKARCEEFAADSYRWYEYRTKK